MTWYIRCADHGLVAGVQFHFVGASSNGPQHSMLSQEHHPSWTHETEPLVVAHRVDKNCRAELDWEWVGP